MKLLGRLLWLLLGLIYRLIVLLLFERWIPFPLRSPLAPTETPREPAPAKTKRKSKSERPAPEPARAARPIWKRAARAAERPFFAAESSELSPELAARLEGEHWQSKRPKPRERAALPRQREDLAGLLRSRRALRDAIVLGTALAPRRPKP